jgi:hypothetical protein
MTAGTPEALETPHTIADRLREGCTVIGWCPRCLFVEPICLATLVELGFGSQSLEAFADQYRCGSCKSRGQLVRRDALDGDVGAASARRGRPLLLSRSRGGSPSRPS